VSSHAGRPEPAEAMGNGDCPAVCVGPSAPNDESPVVRPPERTGTAVRIQRRRWARRALRTIAVVCGTLLLLAIGVPTFMVCWGAAEARLDVERARGELREAGAPQLFEPHVDRETGLRQRFLGYDVGPLRSLRANAYSSVMRRAVERDELQTKRHLMRERSEVQALFAHGGLELSESGETILCDGVRVVVERYVHLVTGDPETRRLLPDPMPPPPMLSAAVEPSGNLICFTSTSFFLGCGETTSSGVVDTYWTFDTRDGEYLQRFVVRRNDAP